jgi:hypothetical protein
MATKQERDIANIDPADVARAMNRGRVKQARLVIYASETGRGDWQPVAPDQVPAFVKRSEVLGRLLDGDMASDAAEGDRGSMWYRAARVLTEAEQAAMRKREMRAQKRRMN